MVLSLQCKVKTHPISKKKREKHKQIYINIQCKTCISHLTKPCKYYKISHIGLRRFFLLGMYIPLAEAALSQEARYMLLIFLLEFLV